MGASDPFEPSHLFVMLTITMLLIFGIVLGGSTRQDIMAHWGERRCDLEIMFLAYLYKPESYTGSAVNFASENFNFCIGAKAADYLKTIFAQLFEVMEKQMGAADIMRNVLNSLRDGIGQVFNPFSTMMNKFWNKFKQMGALASRIFQQIYMAMKKAAGVAVASIYLAISLQTSIMNGIDLVINIIMIVLYILLALAILFFLPILPVMIFVFIATAGIESAFPGRTGGMGEVFCFAPDTKVLISGRSYKKIQEVLIGDTLADGSTVEAVIELPGSLEVLYDLDGIYVSGQHRVWFEGMSEFVCVKDHPDAIITDIRLNTLWTLVTSSRQIPVMGDFCSIKFADWEELPSTPEFSEGWNKIVQDMLNYGQTEPCIIPKCAPCLDASMKVRTFQAGLIPLMNVKRGDWIFDDSKWTRVIGICRREVDGGIGDKGARMSDGNWILDSDKRWCHPSGEVDNWKWQGIQLITESGKFRIYTADLNNSHIVRDFTEVGIDRLAESYVREDKLLSEKKLGADK
jgi:hypothetical protein